MDLRRRLLTNAWAQLALLAVAAVLANTWAARSFLRVDLTEDRVYSLDLTTRALMYKLDKPLIAKVYFTKGLQAPYNNVERLLTDKLEDLRAYSRGLMDIQVMDPTNLKEPEEEAERFGIHPIQYRYRDSERAELKRVFMGLVLVYGEKQEVMPAVTQTETIEYDLARAIKGLVSEEERKTVGYSTGHGEPDIGTQGGPVATLRTRLAERYNLVPVELGGPDLVPEEVDALFVVGPQQTVDERSKYQLDQFLMRGGALAVFLSNTKPDMRTFQPQYIHHGLEALVGSYGVQVNRDVVVDRTRNGQMNFPVLQGRQVVQQSVNYPLIPRATQLNRESVVVRDLDSMLFPFASSLTLSEPMPADVEAVVLAATSDAAGRIKGVRTIAPDAYKLVAPGEERGSWPLLVALTGTWRSYFAEREVPRPADGGTEDDPATKLRESAPTRLVVSGSADFIANNVPFVLNLADWLVQDESLIAIRSKVVKLPTLRPIEPADARWYKAANLAGGPFLLIAFGAARWGMRRRAWPAPVRPAESRPPETSAGTTP